MFSPAPRGPQLSTRILTHSTTPQLNATSFYTLLCISAPRLEGVFSWTRCLPSIKKAQRPCYLPLEGLARSTANLSTSRTAEHLLHT